MRLGGFRHGNRTNFGALLAEGTLELAKRAGPPIPESNVVWLAAIPSPGKILCVGLNYKTHLIETCVAIPRHPAFFVRFPGSVVGYGQPALRPFLSEQFDYEGELAVIIGARDGIFRSSARWTMSPVIAALPTIRSATISSMRAKRPPARISNESAPLAPA